MNTRNRLLGPVVGLVLLAGCQSLEIPPEETQSNIQPQAGADERTTQVAMTLPRPRPPQAEPLALQPQLPEPGVPAPPNDISFSEPEPDRRIVEIPTDPPLHPAEPAAPQRSVAVPYVPTGGWEFRLSQPRRPVEAPVLAFAPSSRALAGAEEPPAATEVAPTRAPAVASPAVPAAVNAAPPAAPPRAVESGTPVARAPAAAAPPAATQTARVQTARQHTDAEPGQRELVARRGDPIAIDLEGSGWIYTGLRTDGIPGSGEQGGIDFLSGRNTPDRTSFNFKAAEYGDYELTFQHQDHRQAVTRIQVVHLRVVPEQDFAAALQQLQPGLPDQPEGTAAGFESVPGPPIHSADALFELGEYELALIEYKRNRRSDDPYLNDRLAECYEHTGEYLAAAKYYRENLGLEGEYGDRAAAGLVRSSIATEDSRLLLEVLPSLFSLESVQIGGELLEVARFQTEDRHFPVAIQALEQYLERYPAGRNLDEVYFRLARIYEVDSPYRDLEAARHYYGLLYESFPESIYADPAAERLDYLNRHFFLVQ